MNIEQVKPQIDLFLSDEDKARVTHFIDQYEQGDIYEQFYTLSRIKDIIQVKYFENPLFSQKDQIRELMREIFKQLNELIPQLRKFEEGSTYVIGNLNKIILKDIQESPERVKSLFEEGKLLQCDYIDTIEGLSKLLQIFNKTEKLAFLEYCKYHNNENPPSEIRDIHFPFDFTLNQVRKQIEAPQTDKDQESKSIPDPLILNKPNVYFYRIIKSLIDVNCFKDTTNDNIVNKFCSIVTGKEGELSSSSYRTQIRDGNEKDILEVINSLCNNLYNFEENYKIDNGKIIKKP